MFIDRMLENAEERGRMVRFAKELSIKLPTARQWWECCQKTKEAPYKLSKMNTGCKSSFIFEHEEYTRNLLDEDPQL